MGELCGGGPDGGEAGGAGGDEACGGGTDGREGDELD